MSKISIAGAASGTATFTIESPATSTNRTITIPDATTTLVGTDATQTLTNKTLTSPTLTSPTIDGTPVMGASVITSGTAQASTSGTSIDFTGIPSWVKRITLIFNEVSLSGSSSYLVQIGSGGFSTSGYVSTCNGTNQSSATGGINSTSGLCWRANNSGGSTSGHMVITLISSNTWIASLVSKNATTEAQWGAGSSPNLAGALDRVRITTINGTDTFDAGSINILYE